MTGNMKVASSDEALNNTAYLDALKELLFQLADDDFILAYRGSEWLGLAPHIEEDVAFSSMSQDMMGHAVIFYEMLEALGAGSADDLAQLRDAGQFRNALLTERVNGSGTYLAEPHFDWAYALIRYYMYGLFKQVRLESLMNGSYEPLSHLARKIMTEHSYHLMHWSVWLNQLGHSTDEAKQRLNDALAKVWEDLGSLFELGPKGDAIVANGLIEGKDLLLQRFSDRAKKVIETASLIWPGKPQTPAMDGRAGEHTPELEEALQTLSEVYRLDPTATW